MSLKRRIETKLTSLLSLPAYPHFSPCCLAPRQSGVQKDIDGLTKDSYVLQSAGILPHHKAWLHGSTTIVNTGESQGFAFVIKEFASLFNSIIPLCQAIRNVLFPYKDGELFTGTPQAPEVLYRPIINVFPIQPTHVQLHRLLQKLHILL